MIKKTMAFQTTTAIKHDVDIKNGNVLATTWHPNLKYAWDTGIAYGRYFLELKKGRLIGSECKKCHRIVVPPRISCEWCFRPMDGWVYLKDTGTVNTFSIAYIDWKADRVKEPFLPAVIEIDGTTRIETMGMGILHLLGEVDPKDVKIGMRVKAVWKPPKERTGDITDIKYFKPLKEGR